MARSTNVEIISPTKLNEKRSRSFAGREARRMQDFLA